MGKKRERREKREERREKREERREKREDACILVDENLKALLFLKVPEAVLAFTIDGHHQSSAVSVAASTDRILPSVMESTTIEGIP